MTTPLRQVWLFRVGCWSAVGAAVLHLAAHLLVPPDLPAHAAVALAQTPAPHVFRVPGLLQPSFADVVSGLSLALPLLLASIGGAGLAVVRHGGHEPRLMRGVAGSFALGAGALLVVSIALFFGLQTFAIAIVALCFALAAVPEQ